MKEHYEAQPGDEGDTGADSLLRGNSACAADRQRVSSHSTSGHSRLFFLSFLSLFLSFEAFSLGVLKYPLVMLAGRILCSTLRFLPRPPQCWDTAPLPTAYEFSEKET